MSTPEVLYESGVVCDANGDYGQCHVMTFHGTINLSMTAASLGAKSSTCVAVSSRGGLNPTRQSCTAEVPSTRGRLRYILL